MEGEAGCKPFGRDITRYVPTDRALVVPLLNATIQHVEVP
jgi:hypothetical protein